MPIFDSARRQVLKGGAAVMAAGALGSLSALQSRQAQAATSPSTRLAPAPSRYGPLAPVADQSTGLLQLPQGFSYRSFGWSGERMDDGQPCPDRHDGMTVVGLRRPDWRPGSDPLRGLEYVLIRNHERGAGSPFRAPAMYDTGIVNGTQQASECAAHLAADCRRRQDDCRRRLPRYGVLRCVLGPVGAHLIRQHPDARHHAGDHRAVGTRTVVSTALNRAIVWPVHSWPAAVGRPLRNGLAALVGAANRCRWSNS